MRPRSCIRVTVPGRAVPCRVVPRSILYEHHVSGWVTEMTT